MSNKSGKGLNPIDYLVGKSKTRDGAEALAGRTNEILGRLNNGQKARVYRIANAYGTYGYSVKVTKAVQA